MCFHVHLFLCARNKSAILTLGKPQHERIFAHLQSGGGNLWIVVKFKCFGSMRRPAPWLDGRVWKTKKMRWTWKSWSCSQSKMTVKWADILVAANRLIDISLDLWQQLISFSPLEPDIRNSVPTLHKSFQLTSPCHFLATTKVHIQYIQGLRKLVRSP